jgi:hypothetical protein
MVTLLFKNTIFTHEFIKITSFENNYYKLRVQICPGLKDQMKLCVRRYSTTPPAESSETSNADELSTETLVESTVDEPSGTETMVSNDPISYQDIISMLALDSGLKRTKSGVAAGLDGEVKANYSEKKLQDLHTKLRTQKYKPSPVKRVQIPKPDGGQRPLGISSQTDKIVQASILNHFEPKLEAMFYESSFGFRPKRGTHDALHKIKRKWQNVT